MKTALLVICTLIFLTNSDVLLYLYPDATTNYDEFLKHYYLEDKINEVLFCLLFLYAFFKSKGIRKGIACFGFVIVFASVIDKVFFEIYTYIYSDLIVLIFGSVLGYLAYKRQ